MTKVITCHNKGQTLVMTCEGIVGYEWLPYGQNRISVLARLLASPLSLRSATNRFRFILFT